MAELAAARDEIARLQTQPVDASTPAIEKPTRKRTAKSPGSKKAAAAAATVSLHDQITAMESGLDSQRSIVAALTQERDDWARNVARHEESASTDPAGLGLARRSLADSEERLHSTTAEIDHLEQQTRALRRIEERSRALASVPDDDLTQIKGIKKVINEQLRAHGIRTWRQIAEWNEEELQAISELLAFKNRAVREKWKEQARALHEAAHGPLN